MCVRELRNNTRGARGRGGGSHCAHIDFSLVNLDLDFIIPS